jgi:hypothetical protein
MSIASLTTDVTALLSTFTDALESKNGLYAAWSALAISNKPAELRSALWNAAGAECAAKKTTIASAIQPYWPRTAAQVASGSEIYAHIRLRAEPQLSLPLYGDDFRFAAPRGEATAYTAYLQELLAIAADYISRGTFVAADFAS